MKTYNGKVESSLYYCAIGICQSCHYNSERPDECMRHLIKDACEAGHSDEIIIENQRKTIGEQKAEIERLEHIKATINEFWDILMAFKILKGTEKPTLENFAEAIQEIENEAKRKYAERLKTRKQAFPRADGIIYAVPVSQIDDLLAEMVGDNNVQSSN